MIEKMECDYWMAMLGPWRPWTMEYKPARPQKTVKRLPKRLYRAFSGVYIG